MIVVISQRRYGCFKGLYYISSSENKSLLQTAETRSIHLELEFFSSKAAYFSV